MTLKMFSILDTKSDTFLSPFFFSTAGQATRAFKDLVNDPNTTISRHPGDYRLFIIGLFDDSKGLVTPLETIEPLGYATDYQDLRSDLPVGVSPFGKRSA